MGHNGWDHSVNVIDEATKEVLNFQWCGNCREHINDHADNQKCMFDSTYFTPQRMTMASTMYEMKTSEEDGPPWDNGIPYKTPKQHLENFKEKLRKKAFRK